MKVYKWALPIEYKFSLDLPVGAKILKVELQHSQPCLWALVDPERENEKRNFLIAGTGHEIEEENIVHISTFQTDKGTFIFHIFEIKKDD